MSVVAEKTIMFIKCDRFSGQLEGSRRRRRRQVEHKLSSAKLKCYYIYQRLKQSVTVASKRIFWRI